MQPFIWFFESSHWGDLLERDLLDIHLAELRVLLVGHQFPFECPEVLRSHLLHHGFGDFQRFLLLHWLRLADLRIGASLQGRALRLEGPLRVRAKHLWKVMDEVVSLLLGDLLDFLVAGRSSFRVVFLFLCLGVFLLVCEQDIEDWVLEDGFGTRPFFGVEL